MTTDTERLQAAHDLTVHMGADCSRGDVSKALELGAEAKAEAQDARVARRVVKNAEAMQERVATRDARPTLSTGERTYTATEAQLSTLMRMAKGELPTPEQLKGRGMGVVKDEIRVKAFLFWRHRDEYAGYEKHFILAQQAGLI
jgi:hypothetical protein